MLLGPRLLGPGVHHPPLTHTCCRASCTQSCCLCPAWDGAVVGEAQGPWQTEGFLEEVVSRLKAV